MVDTIATHILAPDTQAVLLLCGRFGLERNRDLKPLSAAEYDGLAGWLLQHEMRPGALLESQGLARLQQAGSDLPVALPRVEKLLERGAALALAVESWVNKGLWVISRSDDSYPRRLRMGRLGPPLLYGIGQQALLSQGGLAIVGSREADEEALTYTQRIAVACAEQGISVLSGGARGVDSEAMSAALEVGGTVVGILADSLARAAVAGKYRLGLLEGRLTLISPYDPNCGFDVGNAMGRNKYIYALADWALVISASQEKGGTWAGAVEALKTSKRPVFVRTQGSVPEGNRQLLEKGAFSFPDEPWTELTEQLRKRLSNIAIVETPQPQTDGEVISPNVGYSGMTASVSSTSDVDESPTDPLATAFDLVLPLILTYLTQPLDAKSLAERLDVRPGQVQDWLQRAVQARKVMRVGKSPRYIVAPPNLPLEV